MSYLLTFLFDMFCMRVVNWTTAFLIPSFLCDVREVQEEVDDDVMMIHSDVSSSSFKYVLWPSPHSLLAIQTLRVDPCPFNCYIAPINVLRHHHLLHHL